MSPAAKRGPPTSGLSTLNWRLTPASHKPADRGLRQARPVANSPCKLWLFPRCFLLAAFHLQPQRAAGESGGVEIALGADALEIQHGAKPIGRRFGRHGAGIRLRRRAV